MAKKTTTGSGGQIIAENRHWRLSICADRGGFGIYTWVLRKRLTDDGMESAWISSFGKEEDALSACRDRGLVVVRKKPPVQAG